MGLLDKLQSASLPEVSVPKRPSLPDSDGGDGSPIKPRLLLLAALVAVIVWFGYTRRLYLLAVINGQATILGFPPDIFAFLFGALVVGIAFIPLLAYVAGPMLPAFISEPLSNLLLMVSMAGVRDFVLEQKETDEYQIRDAPEDLGPRSFWSRWAGANFGITFEPSREAFSTTVDSARRQELENLEGYSSAVVDLPEFNRGGKDWFLHKDDLKADILVPLGEKLAELRDAAGPDIAIEAYAEALKEHGGDSSEISQKWMIIGYVGLFVWTSFMGWVVFFN